MSTHLVINEFEAEEGLYIIEDIDGGYGSDVSSDSGSEWEIDFVDEPDCVTFEVEDQRSASARQYVLEALSATSSTHDVASCSSKEELHRSSTWFHGFIGTDTLRSVMPPIKDDVMPHLQIAAPQTTSGLVQRPSVQQAAPVMVTQTYQHNPYQYRVIHCRTTSRPFGTASEKAEASYDKLPPCPCQLAALLPAHHCGNSSSPAVPSPQPEKPLQPRPMCCYFKQKGFCKMGEACWYAHEGSLYTPCHYGASCKAGHATLTRMQDSHYSAPSFDESAHALASMSGLPVRVGIHPAQRCF